MEVANFQSPAPHHSLPSLLQEILDIKSHLPNNNNSFCVTFCERIIETFTPISEKEFSFDHHYDLVTLLSEVIQFLARCKSTTVAKTFHDIHVETIDCDKLLELYQRFDDIAIKLIPSHIAMPIKDLVEATISEYEANMKIMLQSMRNDKEFYNNCRFAKNNILSLNVIKTKDIVIQTDYLLGKGRVAVYNGKYKDCDVAIKQVPNKYVNEAVNDVRFLTKLKNSDMVIKYFGVNNDTNHTNIILEKACYKSLSHVIKTLDLKTIPITLLLAWMCDMAKILEILYEHRITHEDIKGDNFLVLEHLNLKICDFGFAKEHSIDSTSRSSASSDGINVNVSPNGPPEKILHRPSSYPADIYNFGKTWIDLITGNSSESNIMEKLELAMKRLSLDQEHELFKLLSSCISVLPNDRPVASDVYKRCFKLLQSCGGDPRDSDQPEDISRMANIKECLSSIIPPPLIHTNLKHKVHSKLLVFDNETIREAVGLWCTKRSHTEREYGHISKWNTSAVTDMSNLFADREAFNDDISDWDVRKVKNMSYMFTNAREFNQPLNRWNVQNVETMKGMFHGAIKFNQPLSKWKVGRVNDMSYMFRAAMSFNQSLNLWNVSKVTTMKEMFHGATNFNSSVSKWNVCEVVDMGYMFSYASKFNQDINNWKISKVTNLEGTFYCAESFNQPLGQWDVSKVTNMSYMFYSAIAFNHPLPWNDKVGNVVTMNDMFHHATHFNQPLNDWNVRNVTDMNFMFSDANWFNQPLDKWKVNKVTDMRSMFKGATMFNQSLEEWDVSSVKDMNLMFCRVTAYNQPLNKWNVSNVIDMREMFRGASNFDQKLDNWKVKENVDTRFMFHLASNFSRDNKLLLQSKWSRYSHDMFDQ